MNGVERNIGTKEHPVVARFDYRGNNFDGLHLTRNKLSPQEARALRKFYEDYNIGGGEVPVAAFPGIHEDRGKVLADDLIERIGKGKDFFLLPEQVRELGEYIKRIRL
jgi:hypothetical protein